jgi:hypothetical protein
MLKPGEGPSSNGHATVTKDFVEAQAAKKGRAERHIEIAGSTTAIWTCAACVDAAVTAKTGATFPIPSAHYMAPARLAGPTSFTTVLSVLTLGAKSPKTMRSTRTVGGGTTTTTTMMISTTWTPTSGSRSEVVGGTTTLRWEVMSQSHSHCLPYAIFSHMTAYIQILASRLSTVQLHKLRNSY